MTVRATRVIQVRVQDMVATARDSRPGTFGHHVATLMLRTGKPHYGCVLPNRWTRWEFA